MAVAMNMDCIWQWTACRRSGYEHGLYMAVAVDTVAMNMGCIWQWL